MPALLVVHDVDDVDHWLKSPKREQLMGPRGFTVRTFVDPTDSNRVNRLPRSTRNRVAPTVSVR